MAARKRTPQQILRDRAEIAARYLKGQTQAQIATSVGLSRQQVGYDLRAIQEEWRQSALRDFDTHKAEALAKIDALERTYWEAWQRSCEPLDITATEKGEDEVQVRAGHAGRLRLPAHRTRMKASKRTEQQGGNPAYLSGIERCIAARCRILGLYAPNAVHVNGTMTFADLYRLAAEDGEQRHLRLVPSSEGNDDPEDASGL